MAPRFSVGAEVAAQASRRHQQRIQPDRRRCAIVGVQAQAAADRHQRARHRVLERPLRQDELDVARWCRPGSARRAPTSRAITGSPAQGCAVRSCWLTPCADFGVPPGSGMLTTSGGASGRSRSRSSACSDTTP